MVWFCLHFSSISITHQLFFSVHRTTNRIWPHLYAHLFRWETVYMCVCVCVCQPGKQTVGLALGQMLVYAGILEVGPSSGWQLDPGIFLQRPQKPFSQILIDEIWVLLPSWIKFCIQRAAAAHGELCRAPTKTFDNPPLTAPPPLRKTSHPALEHSHCPGLQFPCPKLFKLSIQRPFSCLFLWLLFFPLFTFF